MDDWDRRTLKTVLGKYLVDDALENNFKMSESGIYASPPVGSLSYYRDLIKNFPSTRILRSLACMITPTLHSN